jgi:hypothetical protein
MRVANDVRKVVDGGCRGQVPALEEHLGGQVDGGDVRDVSGERAADMGGAGRDIQYALVRRRL